MDRKDDEIMMPENEEINKLERRVSMPPREFGGRPPMPPRRFEAGPGRGRERGWGMPDDPRFRGPRERMDRRFEDRPPFGPGPGPYSGERRRPTVEGQGPDMRPPMGPPPGQGMGMMPPMPFYGYGGYMPQMMPVMMVPVMVAPVMYPGMMPPMTGPGMMPPMGPPPAPGFGMRPPMMPGERGRMGEIERNMRDASAPENMEKHK